MIKENKELENPDSKWYPRSFFQRDNFNKREPSFLLAMHLITHAMTYKVEVPGRLSNGSVPIDCMLDFLASSDDSLGQVDFEHLVELYLRTTDPLFTIEGNDLVPVLPVNKGSIVTPPDVLYFGTHSAIALQAQVGGLKSIHSSLVVMTDRKDLAVVRAKKFSRERKGSRPILVVIDAKRASASGVEFLVGDKRSLYLASHIDRLFLDLEEVKSHAGYSPVEG
jgi:hypothetical protein